MRISDWSADVCSSDLPPAPTGFVAVGCPRAGTNPRKGLHNMVAKALSFDVGDYVVYPKHGVGRVVELQKQEIAGMQLELYVLRFEKEKRSEEHTSELQSLMRISYAVICLKNTNINK